MKAYSFKIYFRVIEPIHLPRYNKGNVLRGAFGQSLRSLVCVHPTMECHECSIRECVYRDLFNPLSDPAGNHLSKNLFIQRPYVFKPPLEKRELYAPGADITFGMILFGRAINFLPYIIVSLKELAEKGFGRGRGTAHLERITQSLPKNESISEILSRDGTVQPRSDLFFTETDIPIPHTDRVALTFKTPAILKDRGAFVQVPTFAVIIKRLRDRFSALSWFYEGTVPDIDFKNFTREAEMVKTIDCRCTYIQSSRKNRKNTRHDMSGVIGRLAFDGPVQKYLPYLLFGQYMHVGKSAVFGNGWYDLEVG